MTFDPSQPAVGSPLASGPVRENFQALGARIDEEHNADGTHKDAVRKTGDTSTGQQAIEMNNPCLRLIGTEAGGKDYIISESGGYLFFSVNTNTKADPIWKTLFKLDSNGLLSEYTKLNQSNLAAETSIPITMLSELLDEDLKVEDEHLPTSLVRADSTTPFSVEKTFDAGAAFGSSVDVTYKARITKTSTAGEAKVEIYRKQTGVVVTSFYFRYNSTNQKGTFVADILSAAQVVSTAAQGSAPFVVSSTTMVVNLNAEYVGGVPYHNAIEASFGAAPSNFRNAIMTPDGTIVGVSYKASGNYSRELFRSVGYETLGHGTFTGRVLASPHSFISTGYGSVECYAAAHLAAESGTSGTLRITKNGVEAASFAIINSTKNAGGYATVSVVPGDVISADVTYSMHTGVSTDKYTKPASVGVLVDSMAGYGLLGNGGALVGLMVTTKGLTAGDVSSGIVKCLSGQSVKISTQHNEVNHFYTAELNPPS